MPKATHRLRVHPAQLASSAVLGVLLLNATLHNKALYAGLDAVWNRVVVALRLAPHLPGLLLPSSPLVPLMHQTNSVPAVALYSVLYLGLCLALLFLLLPAREERRLVLLFYGGAGLVTALLLLSSKAGGGPLLADLVSQLLHFIVSPLPVITLVPLLRWSASQKMAAGR